MGECAQRFPSPANPSDRGFASGYDLPNLETLELRMVDVERLVVSGILVGGTKCLRFGLLCQIVCDA
jgi:hypothetical protein